MADTTRVLPFVAGSQRGTVTLSIDRRPATPPQRDAFDQTGSADVAVVVTDLEPRGARAPSEAPTE